MSTDPARCFPVLASLDITETRDFYVGQLGFTVVWGNEKYLILKRDQMEIHFWKTDDRRFPRTRRATSAADKSRRCTTSSHVEACRACHLSRCVRGT